MANVSIRAIGADNRDAPSASTSATDTSSPRCILGAVEGFRAIKTSITLVDSYSMPPGIPNRDQIDLEKSLE